MAKTSYDPEVTPDSKKWLALPEIERIRLTQKYHEVARIKLPNVKIHAALHAVVENQIAIGYGPTCRAMERLQIQGLTRHDALHAVSSVLAYFIYERATGADEPQAEFSRNLDDEIEELSAAKWLAMAEDTPEKGD